MSFYKPEDFCIGKRYRLTENIEGAIVSSGNYFLVSLDESGKEGFSIPGFSKSEKRKAEVFLREAHAQFGDATWRRAFKNGDCWDIYPGPIGAITWNWSWVEVEAIEKLE